MVKISFKQFDAISVVDNCTCIDRGQLSSIVFYNNIVSFEHFNVISVVDNSTCIDRGQLSSIVFLTVTLFRLSLFSYAVNRDALSATLETIGELHGAEMCPAIVSGIVTGDATVSY